MTVSNKQRKKEVQYLENKDKMKKLFESLGYENMLRYMIEDLDNIEDVNNTQSVYLFQLISVLENALEIYPRIQNAQRN